MPSDFNYKHTISMRLRTKTHQKLEATQMEAASGTQLSYP